MGRKGVCEMGYFFDKDRGLVDTGYADDDEEGLGSLTSTSSSAAIAGAMDRAVAVKLKENEKARQRLARAAAMVGAVPGLNRLPGKLNSRYEGRVLPSQWHHIVRPGDMPAVLAVHLGGAHRGADGLRQLAAVNPHLSANGWAGWVVGARVVLPAEWGQPGYLPPIPTPEECRRDLVDAATQAISVQAECLPKGLEPAPWRFVLQVCAADALEGDHKGAGARLLAAFEGLRLLLPRYVCDRFVHRYDRKTALARLDMTGASEPMREAFPRLALAYEQGRAS